MLTPAKRENLDEKEAKLRRVQENLIAFLDVIAKVPFLDGVLLTDVALTTSDLEVAHKLGKRPAFGFIVTRRNGTGVVYESSTAPSDASRMLVLKASASVTVDLWVF